MLHTETTSINDLPDEILKNEILPRLSTIHMMSAFRVSHRFEKLLPDSKKLQEEAHKIASVRIKPWGTKKEDVIPLKKILHYIKENDLANLKKMAEVINFSKLSKHSLDISRPNNTSSFVDLGYFDMLVALSSKEIRDYMYSFTKFYDYERIYGSVVYGDSAIFEVLLNSQDWDPDFLRKSFEMAAYSGKENLVDLFINHPAITYDQLTRLNYTAAEGGHLAILKKTLARQNKLAGQDSPSYFPALLYCACTGGHLKVVDYLLSLPLSQHSGNSYDEVKGFALSLAIKNTHPHMVKRMLEEKDINMGFISGMPFTNLIEAIYHAARIGSLEIFDLIMAHPQIDVNLSRPLDHAICCLTMNDYISDKPFNNTILLTIIKRLLDKGVQVTGELDTLNKRIQTFDLNDPKLSDLKQAKTLIEQAQIERAEKLETSVLSSPGF